MYSTFVPLPQPTDVTSPKILDSPELYPFFKDCLGVLNGTHIHANISPIDRARYRNSKGFISQNVLAAVSFDMRFAYVLSGWEGSASDGQILEDARSVDFKIPDGKFYLGDGGFPGSESVLVPYHGVHYHTGEWVGAKQE